MTERRTRTSTAIEEAVQKTVVRQRKKSVHFPQEIESPIDTQSEDSVRKVTADEQPFDVVLDAAEQQEEA